MHSCKKIITLLAAGAIAASSVTFTAFAQSVQNPAEDFGKSSSRKEALSMVYDETSPVVARRFPLSMEQKVDDLVNLGIIEGDPDGNFRLSDTLSRAEFAKISCLLLGLNANVSQESTFADVDANHWASGYITTAQKSGIINGYEDGTFKPDNDVSYSEAIKMIVSALGYTPMAEVRGGYPGGFVAVANQQGFDIDSDLDVTSAIKREVAFGFVQFALDVPLMEQTGFGENTEYSVMDGKNDIAYRTLRTNLLSAEEPVYNELSSSEMAQFASDNKELIEEDIAGYWKRMKYEGEYTYEILSVSRSTNGTDVCLKVALFDESQNRYINLALNYKYISGQIK